LAKFKEAKISDFVYFNGKSGTASIVKTDNNINYFVPSKIEMQQIQGIKKPIVKFERFIISNFTILRAEKERVIRIEMIRQSDASVVRISENEFNKYFFGF